MGINDGLGFEEVNQTNSSTSVVNATTISGTTLKGTTITNSNGNLESSKVGTSFGAMIQGGSAALGAGSNVWVVYDTAFTGAAIPVATDMTSAGQALLIPVGSLSAGSFYIEGPTASDEFSWIAIGI